jgi:hypothetical protein
MSSMRLVPISLREAGAFIAAHHRHNKPPRGWKFGTSVRIDDSIVGVATAGRPVSREVQQREPLTIEVNRTCTDGTANANSMLYGAIWRAAKALGYTRAITYIQGEETGASLKAAGWRKVKDLPARGSWAESSVSLREIRDPVGNGGVARQLWEITSSTAGRGQMPDFVAGHAAGHTPLQAGQMAEKRDICSGTSSRAHAPYGGCPCVPLGGHKAGHGRDRNTPARGRCVPIPPCAAHGVEVRA